MNNGIKSKLQSLLNYDKVSFIILYFGILLTPLIVFPLFDFSIDITKKFFLVIAVVLSLIFWSVGRAIAGRISFPKNWVLVSLLFVCVVYLLSALFSSSVGKSLIGFGFENGTFFSILVFSILSFLASIFFQSKKRFLNFYFGLFAVFAAVFLFQSARYVFGNFLPWWPMFNYGASNLIGKWNELAIFAGLVALSAVIMIEFLSLRSLKFLKYFIWIIFVASLLTLALINFFVLWIILAIFSFLIYIYYVSFVYRQEGKKALLRPSLIILILAVAFLILGRGVPYGMASTQGEGWLAKQVRLVSQKLNIATLEVRPSVVGTMQIAQESLKNHPVLGVGPNRFLGEWLKYKPTGVNDTAFWNIELDYGYGIIPTFLVTTGLLGALAWLILFGLLLYYGIRSIFFSAMEGLNKSFLLLSFCGLAYLWTFIFIYIPDTPMLALTFALTGIFIARLVDAQVNKNADWSFTYHPKVQFASLVVIAIFTVSQLIFAYIIIFNYWSLLVFRNGLYQAQVKGDLAAAEKAIQYANGLNPQDTYFRSAVDINVAQLNQVLGSKLSQQQLLAEYSKVFERAKTNADRSVAMDETNYLNYVYRGRIYENIQSLGVKGSYDIAKQNYISALKYNPHNPALYLNLARLEVANQNIPAAKDYIAKSLAEKKDYLDAIFFQSQLYAEQGDLNSAIKKAEQAAMLAPNDVGVLFQLGYLQFRNNDYRGAINTFKGLINQYPNYSNAKYFLGLSYDKLGDTPNAIAQFVDIQKLNPDNTDVERILINLANGRDALAGTAPVEKQTKPPIKQK